ncbi:3-hydroxyisobutyrate dehydrogenase [hydrothermal vent metagenome]|uniref:3-hydroxyisobutyrate dehydrogenase n=1 Tax=hydrothermal vent metagenome TaxID=652676 RepID=A0A3B0T6U4_9ZZZZ
MAKILFVGLGNMGLPMAKNLSGAGHQVTGCDPAPGAKQRAREAGLDFAGDAAAAAGKVEAIVTMLPAGAHVRSVYLGQDGLIEAAAPGAVLIDSSTIDVATARDVAEAAAAAGHLMVDAPVSGGVGGAEAGGLTFMVGGPEEAFARAGPLLEVMGKTIVHAGDAGNGQAAKICNNLILGISMIGVSEAFVLAEKLGLDHQKLFDISSTASGQCWSMTTYCPVPGPVPSSPANRDYKAGFAVDMMLKDLKLAADAAQSAGASSPLGGLAEALYSLYSASGQGAADFSGIIRFLRGQT